MTSSLENLTPAALGCPVNHGFNPALTGPHSDPFDWYAEAREIGPVQFVPSMGPTGMYVVTRWDEVLHVLKDPVTYSNAESLGHNQPIPEEILKEEGADWRIEIDKFLTLADPPEHPLRRKFMAPSFTPKRMKPFEAAVEQLANDLIDGFKANGNADFALDFAHKVPARIIGEVVGAGMDMADQFVAWTNALLRIRFNGTAGELTKEELLRDWRMLVENDKYTRQLMADRKENPADDLATDFLNATKPDGSRALTDEEVVVSLFNLFGAGSESSAIMMINIMDLLLNNPDQLALLQADPSLIDATVEEALRLRGPVRGLVRVVLEDTEVGGVPIPAGSRVYLSLISANHDENQFDNPREFNIRRETRDGHLGFGKFSHVCIGAPLARMEGRIAVGTFIKRLPGLRFAADQGPIEYSDNPVLPAVNNLRVEWDR